MKIIEEILNKRVTRVYHNYNEKSMTIYFEENLIVHFHDCVIVFDLGIIGHIITYVSINGTLGMVSEIKRYKLNPEDYEYILLSRDINDFENKNEIVISYKRVQVERMN